MAGETIEIRVEGMTCGGCEASVVRALSALPGVSEPRADRQRGVASFVSSGATDAQQAVAAVNAIGFDAST